MANAEAALIALRGDSPSVTVLADDEWSAENFTGEWSPRAAAKNDTSAPQNIHSLSIRGQYASRRPPHPAPRREVDTAEFKCRQHCACARVPGDAAFDSGTVWSRDILLSRRVWNCDSSRRMCTAFPAFFFTFTPFFYVRLLDTTMSELFYPLVCFCLWSTRDAGLAAVRPTDSRKRELEEQVGYRTKYEECFGWAHGTVYLFYYFNSSFFPFVALSICIYTNTRSFCAAWYMK
ncbi:hypothetical protein TCDM_09781 [Trypanosoma cruzi Dm28c]|uniref:Uncharacterized protein n=1 Tax=Trypanosoma cruzi Dm28c TaxID=1416333 RepID=V5B963_TRYCR|nr:hypothetical protein TCDM_09781 [Trypanosoma cruzi Dm28c]